MPFKYDPTGAIVTVKVGDKMLPVFINSRNEEAPFDADSTVSTISGLKSEAQAHREAKEAADAKLKTYTGIDDPKKALAALDTVSKLDTKKLIDAGEVDRVKAEIGAGFKGQLDELTTAKTSLEQRLYNMAISNAFASSEFIKAKLALPADFVQARFAANFKIENDKVYAVDAAGNKIYSKTKHGELANFEEAMEFLVSSHPQRDYLLKGNNASGGGAPGNQGPGNQGAGGKQRVTRSAFEAVKDPVEKAKLATTAEIVDG